MLAAAALNRVVNPHLPADVRAALRDRKLRLRVTDAGIAVDFMWRGDRFAALSPPSPASPPDLQIAASARDFVALARQALPAWLRSALERPDNRGGRHRSKRCS